MTRKYYFKFGKDTATVEQLADCEKKQWYVTECSVRGVVGLCAVCLSDILHLVPKAITEMKELNS